MVEKKEKLGFFYSSRVSFGSAGKRREELPPGISLQEGIPALQPRLGVEALPVENSEESPADVEETHGRAGNPAGTGFVYREKRKFGMRGGTSHLLGLVWPRSVGFTLWNGNKSGNYQFGGFCLN